MKQKTKTKQRQDREWRLVLLTIAGKHLDPEKVSRELGILPDSRGKLGELFLKNSKCKQGYWSIEGGPSTWRIETQMKSILRKISPAKDKLKRLIEEDKTIKQVHLKIAFAPPRDVPNACYCFDAELINEFTSMGIDIALSIQIVERWEKIFADVEAKTSKRRRRGQRVGKK